MNHKQAREASDRYIKAMRDTLGIKREVKLALPPTAPFNDDEYEAMQIEIAAASQGEQ